MKRSPMSCPAIEHFIWIEPVLRGHFVFVLSCLLNTSLTGYGWYINVFLVNVNDKAKSVLFFYLAEIFIHVELSARVPISECLLFILHLVSTQWPLHHISISSHVCWRNPMWFTICVLLKLTNHIQQCYSCTSVYFLTFNLKKDQTSRSRSYFSP